MTRRPQVAVLPHLPQDHPFWRLKAVLIGRTGHHYYADKDDLLWERVQKRMAALRIAEVADYLDRLRHPHLGPQEWAALETEITIGETFFFRYAEQFAALRETILPEIIARKSGDRRLRIWSAGCSNGSEAYSVAIVVHELLGEALKDWRVSILGTDINEAFLEAARAAHYGRWALRTLTPAQYAQWFTEAGPQQWALRPQYRSMARFQRGNLMDMLDGSAPLELSDFDLILCRNVLIYFHHDVVLRLVAAFGERLASDGWLLLGHAEPNPTFSEILQPVQLPGSVVYRRSGAAPVVVPPSPPAVASRPEPQPWAPLIPAAAPPPRPAPPLVERAVTPSPEPAPDLLDEVRRRADAGDFDGAAALCAGGLADRPEDSALQFYDGLIHQARGEGAAAERALRKALYLDPGFVMAHYHLGLLLLADGRAEAGRRAVTAAARTAGTHPATERLREGAGLTAGELRDLARLHLGGPAADQGLRGRKNG